MNKSSPVLLAVLLLAGSALAQTSDSRVDRACTTSTLSTDPAARCSDDVLIDRLNVSTSVRRPPADSIPGSVSAGAGTAIQPGPDATGVASPGAGNISGAGFTGTSMGTTGTGAMPASGAASMPARR